MTKHMTGPRKEWLAARLELLEAENLWGMYQWLDRAPKGRNRDGRLVASPRRVRQGLSVLIAGALLSLRRRRQRQRMKHIERPPDIETFT